MQNTIDAVTGGQFGQGYNMHPQQQAMAQAQALAMAQAFAAMQQQGGPAWNQGYNPQQGGFNPNFNQGFAGPSRQQRQQPFQPPHSNVPTLPIPSKPASEQICKHGVNCTKATCPFSHPSPVATKDSGLVLSSDPCEKQLLCTDIVRSFFFLEFFSLTRF